MSVSLGLVFIIKCYEIGNTEDGPRPRFSRHDHRECHIIFIVVVLLAICNELYATFL